MDPAYDGTPSAEGAFVTGLPWTCFPCESLGKAQASYKKSLPEGHDHGQFQWGVQLVPKQSTGPYQHTT